MSYEYTIHKEVEISAAHSLSFLPPDHKCHKVHGHNYVVQVKLSAAVLQPDGMLLDFGIISAIIHKYDHINLNDFFTPTTAENFARVLVSDIGAELSLRGLDVNVEEVTVWETSKCSATCRRLRSE